MTVLPHTAAEIVSLIRATNNSEFVASGAEAELLVQLFSSAAASDAAAKAIKETSYRMLAAFDRAVERVA